MWPQGEYEFCSKQRVQFRIQLFACLIVRETTAVACGFDAIEASVTCNAYKQQ